MAEPPRSFKLLEEYDNAIGKEGKSFVIGKHQGMITYGLDREDDITLSSWNAMIIGIQGKQTGELMYEVNIQIPDDYPRSAPIATFRRPKIKMDCVDANGRVDLNKIRPPFKWDAKKNIADVLMALRENMADDTVNKQSGGLGGTSY